MTDSPVPNCKIVVFDDDPTGSQTVHSCLLLLRWTVETLVVALRDPSPIFFVLTNTRSLPPGEAEAVTRGLCRNLKQALNCVGNLDKPAPYVMIVSRSDSTLRGHYPLEPKTIDEELGPFDAQFLVPAFLEGGRITKNSVHFVVTKEQGQTVATPVHKTEFARDPAFPFEHSFLPDYIQEKTQGEILAHQVDRLEISHLRGDRSHLVERLVTYHSNQPVTVDGEAQQDLDNFAAALRAAQAIASKRYLFRSAASLLTSLANLPPQEIAPENMGRYCRSEFPGVIIVGSYVEKTTQQLHHLLQQPGAIALEIPVAQLTESNWIHYARTLQTQLHHHWHQHQTPVVHTSRNPHRADPGQTTNLITSLITHLVHTLPQSTSYLISKGGITTNNILSQSLDLTAVRLLGQIIPGVSLITTPRDHPQYPHLPVVTFPGNVGGVADLTEVYRRLTTASPD
ncbi:MAG: four-carbon acid sugar kinase family protein [Cyanobacteria bacterium P01_C01_bin.89]